MPSELFHRIAQAEGWSEATRTSLLLRFMEAEYDHSAFSCFIAQIRAASQDDDIDPADRFMWEVIALLGNPGLAINGAFQQFCLNCHDLLTAHQAAERWCCWAVA